MATSNFPTIQCTADQFVESCGAILFDLTQEPKQVCLLHYLKKDEWMIAKVRHNCGESRLEAARREFEEETSYKYHLHPMLMSTRAPGITESAHVVDEARSYADIT